MELKTLKVVDDGQVVGRVANDEVVIINFATGMYFSLSGAGTDIWTLLSEGISLDRLSAVLSARYDEPLEQICGDLVGLIDEMTAAGLIRTLDAGVSADVASVILPPPGPYSRPTLTAYDDLADSFAVDPPLMVA